MKMGVFGSWEERDRSETMQIAKSFLFVFDRFGLKSVGQCK
jgi:hypothetical protein